MARRRFIKAVLCIGMSCWLNKKIKTADDPGAVSSRHRPITGRAITVRLYEEKRCNYTFKYIHTTYKNTHIYIDICECTCSVCIYVHICVYTHTFTVHTHFFFCVTSLCTKPLSSQPTSASLNAPIKLRLLSTVCCERSGHAPAAPRLPTVYPSWQRHTALAFSFSARL